MRAGLGLWGWWRGGWVPRFGAGERVGELLPTAAAPRLCFEGASSCLGLTVLCVPAVGGWALGCLILMGSCCGMGTLGEAPFSLL